MTSCEKAAIICNKAQYNEASIIDRIKLSFHLFICKNCAAYTKQNQKLTSLCNKANLDGLTDSEKSKMKKTLQEKG